MTYLLYEDKVPGILPAKSSFSETLYHVKNNKSNTPSPYTATLKHGLKMHGFLPDA